MGRNHCTSCGCHGHNSKRCEQQLKPGMEFERWTTVSPVDVGGVRWLCRCRCGTERPVLQQSLRSGKSLSCGCRQRPNHVPVTQPQPTQETTWVNSPTHADQG